MLFLVTYALAILFMVFAQTGIVPVSDATLWKLAILFGGLTFLLFALFTVQNSNHP